MGLGRWGGATVCLHHCPSTGQGCRRTPEGHCRTAARCVILQSGDRQEERDTPTCLQYTNKQEGEPGRNRSQATPTCHSPISSYLIAVPRLAFSSNRDTDTSEQRRKYSGAPQHAGVTCHVTSHTCHKSHDRRTFHCVWCRCFLPTKVKRLT